MIISLSMSVICSSMSFSVSAHPQSGDPTFEASVRNERYFSFGFTNEIKSIMENTLHEMRGLHHMWLTTATCRERMRYKNNPLADCLTMRLVR